MAEALQTIVQGLHAITSQYLDQNSYEERLGEERIKELGNMKELFSYEITLQKELQELDAKIKKRKRFLGKVTGFFASRNNKNYRKWEEIHREVLEREYGLLRYIHQKTSDPALSEPEVKDLEEKLRQFHEAACKASYDPLSIYQCRFQFPIFAEAQIKPYLETPAAELRDVYSTAFKVLRENAVRYEGLAKSLLQKLAEAYEIDVARGKTGKRRLGGVAGHFPTVPYSVADACRWRIEQLGESLGWTAEATWQFVGMTKKQVEENERAAMEKERKITEREGLYHEFGGIGATEYCKDCQHQAEQKSIADSFPK